MAKLYNLARMTTATTGTGTITLGSAVSGFLTFAQAGVANADVVSYGIKDGNNSEVGTGTYTSSGTTLTRTVLASTNAGAAISLSGSAEVFITALKEDFAALVAKAGDTMTGDLQISKATPALNLYSTGDSQVQLNFFKDAKQRWSILTQAGTLADLLFLRFGDAGEFLDIPFSITRSNGRVNLLGDPTSELHAATKQYVDTRVRYDAAPFDALAYNGMQINGSMEVDQVNAGAAVAFATGTANAYAIDGFNVRKIGTNAFSMQQVASTIPGYTKSLKLTVTTASIGSDYISIDNMIEGYRFSRAQWGTANAQPVTIGFWVKSSLAGNMLVQIINGVINAATSIGITITAANVPQWVTGTFPAQTSGAWGNGTNDLAARVAIFAASPGDLNIAATVGNTLEIAGLVVLPGNEAPSATRSPYIMRPYDQELQICKRYWQSFVNPKDLLGFTAYQQAGIGNTCWFTLGLEMRAAPTAVIIGPWAVANCSQPTLASACLKSFGLVSTVTATGYFAFNNTTNAGTGLTLDARL